MALFKRRKKGGPALLRQASSMAVDMRAAADAAAAARTPDGRPDPRAAAALMADALDRAVAHAAGSDPADMPKLKVQDELHSRGDGAAK